jgi:hypothetical protein
LHLVIPIIEGIPPSLTVVEGPYGGVGVEGALPPPVCEAWEYTRWLFPGDDVMGGEGLVTPLISGSVIPIQRNNEFTKKLAV